MPKRILLVEDDVMVRNAVVIILTREKYEVLEADSVAEALCISSSFDGIISLLIADHSLTTMTGRQLAEQMVESRPGLQVLQFLTEARTLPQGTPYLQKPFLWWDLTDGVKRILEQPDMQEKRASKS